MPYVFKPEMDAVMAGMPFGFFRADLHANVVYSNGYLEKSHGLTYDDFKGNAWQKLLHPDDKKNLLMLFAKDYFLDKVTLAATRFLLPGNIELPILFLIDILLDSDGKRLGFLVNAVDVSIALHDLCVEGGMLELDTLTHVLTRISFFEHLDKILRLKKNHPIISALVIIDLKGLDKYNSLWGYSLGDQLLVALAETLRQTMGKECIIGRFESGKFALVLNSVENDAWLQKIVTEIYQACNKTVVFPQGKFTMDVSIGVALTSIDDGEVDPLLRHALEALKSAKQNTPRIEYLHEHQHRVYRRAARIVSSLFDAISQDQFELHYQPQINILTKKIIGLEVLLRWKHPELGFIEPDEFIPIAEESGFIIHVGKWVMDHALKQYQRWSEKMPQRLEGISLSINLSPLQLLDQSLLTEVSELLMKYKMKAKNLIFELTETAVMSDPENSIRVMNQLKELGLSFSMDDFGTGYSSLNYIRSLPISQIKIDRSFVKAFQHSRQDAAVVKATISLAEALGVEVIAEGVETDAELKFLRENGCKLVQGYYYSHPLNAKGMEEYIEGNT